MKNKITKQTMKKNLLAENMRRFGTKNLQEYGSNEDFKGSGLIVQGRTQIDNNEIQDMIDETDYYGVWNDKEGYWFFPEDESTFSYLEADLDVEFDKRGINARFEGQLDESSDSNNFKVAYAGQGFYGIYDAAIDGPIEGEWPSREAAQAAADKKNKFTIEDFPEGTRILFKDGEEWIVVKKGMRGSGTFRKSDEITIKPYNKLAKDRNVSLSIDVNLKYLNNNIDKLVNESLKELDINDPVLMKLRAQKSQSQSKQVPQSSLSPKILNKIKFLEKERERIMFDMEQEAEPEGGPIADKYGTMLDKIDKAINKLNKLNKNTIHIPNLSWQDQTRIIKWLNQQDYDLKDYKVIEKGKDITIDTFGLDRSETKEIESYLKLQNYKFSSNL